MNCVRVIKKENAPDKEEIAYRLLKAATRRRFKAIQEEMLASLYGCGVTVEEMIPFSATVMQEALRDCLGEV